MGLLDLHSLKWDFFIIWFNAAYVVWDGGIQCFHE